MNENVQKMSRISRTMCDTLTQYKIANNDETNLSYTKKIDRIK